VPAILPTNHLCTELSGDDSPAATGLDTQKHLHATDQRVAASLREASGIIAHEITQPLTAILGDAEAALRVLNDRRAVRDILKDIISSVQRATEIIKRLRLMVEGGEPSPEMCSLNEIVMSTLHVLAPVLTNRFVGVELHLDESLEQVKADRVQIQQVIVNLLMNSCEAMDAMPRDRRVVHITSGCSPDGSIIELAIGDSGAGIAECDRERIFEPFVTTKPQGLGLGLAISRLIVNAHGGYLGTEGAGRGALFRMGLPVRGP
jgi:two-component system sensor kinase FixL